FIEQHIGRKAIKTSVGRCPRNLEHVPKTIQKTRGYDAVLQVDRANAGRIRKCFEDLGKKVAAVDGGPQLANVTRENSVEVVQQLQATDAAVEAFFLGAANLASEFGREAFPERREIAGQLESH